MEFKINIGTIKEIEKELNNHNALLKERGELILSAQEYSQYIKTLQKSSEIIIKENSKK